MLLMNPNTKYVYEYTLKFFQNLKFLSVVGCMQLLSIKSISSTTWLSLNLNKLCVDIYSFEDCLALLDGRLTQLSTFIVDIIWPDDEFSTIYNMVSSNIIFSM